VLSRSIKKSSDQEHSINPSFIINNKSPGAKSLLTMDKINEDDEELKFNNESGGNDSSDLIREIEKRSEMDHRPLYKHKSD
jgi:hypothetical protein